MHPLTKPQCYARTPVLVRQHQVAVIRSMLLANDGVYLQHCLLLKGMLRASWYEEINVEEGGREGGEGEMQLNERNE